MVVEVKTDLNIFVIVDEIRFGFLFFHWNLSVGGDGVRRIYV